MHDDANPDLSPRHVVVAVLADAILALAMRGDPVRTPADPIERAPRAPTPAPETDPENASGVG